MVYATVSTFRLGVGSHRQKATREAMMAVAQREAGMTTRTYRVEVVEGMKLARAMLMMSLRIQLWLLDVLFVFDAYLGASRGCDATVDTISGPGCWVDVRLTILHGGCGTDV